MVGAELDISCMASTYGIRSGSSTSGTTELVRRFHLAVCLIQADRLAIAAAFFAAFAFALATIGSNVSANRCVAVRPL